MTTYISLLRGINVSGQKKIKMDALRATYGKLGFQEVTSYVQSGNVVFTASGSGAEEAAQHITRGIKEDFGFDVPVMVLTAEEMKAAIAENPFVPQPDKDPAFMHVTFLASEPTGYDWKALEQKKQGAEEIMLLHNRIYLYCPHGYGRTKLNNNFLESKLNVAATTRNWKTVNELLTLTQNIRMRQ